MKTLAIELRKEKRTGVIYVLPAVGILGAAYAFVNFLVRKDTLLHLPLAPMDVLLTQLYGMIMVLNLFGIVVAACMIYHLEFIGSAVKKMYLLPISVPAMYLCKFLILTVLFLIAILLQNLALVQIGRTDLPDGTFEMGTLLRFAGYSFLRCRRVLKRDGPCQFGADASAGASLCGYLKACSSHERPARSDGDVRRFGADTAVSCRGLVDGEVQTL